MMSVDSTAPKFVVPRTLLHPRLPTGLYYCHLPQEKDERLRRAHALVEGEPRPALHTPDGRLLAC